MLMPAGVKVYLALEPVDLRASFFRLAIYVRAALGQDPKSGHLYVFLGKGRNLVKVLFWDGSGYCIFSKRLAAGRFYLPQVVRNPDAPYEVEFATLTLLLEGIDLTGATQRARYSEPVFQEK